MKMTSSLQVLWFQIKRILQIVFAADGDALVMNPDFLKPVLDNPRVLVWIWQFYSYFQDMYGIPISFIGARKRTWKHIIKYDGNLQSMLDFYKTKRFV